jgi:DNA-binding CsgD family transcriptional regulator
MARKPKNNHAIAYLRQLCCLGLGKELAVYEFLRAVRAVIPSDNNVFTGLKDPFILDYHILGFDVAEVVNLPLDLVAYFMNPERMQKSAAWFSQQPILTNPAAVWGNNYYSTDCYNLVWRPLDQHHMLYTPIFLQGKPIALLGLFRSKTQKPFSSADQDLILKLAPYLSHAIGATVDKDIEYCVSGKSGILIMNTAGSIIYQCQWAKHLLYLASLPTLNVSECIKPNFANPNGELLQKLKQVCRNLENIFKGKPAMPPSWSFTNGHGRFIFSAHWLAETNQEPGGLVAIHIEQHEPQPLKLIRALQHFHLPPVQSEVALLIAEGYSNDEICKRLHVKLTTVKDNVRKIFVKLDIEKREALLPKLLACNSK